MTSVVDHPLVGTLSTYVGAPEAAEDLRRYFLTGTTPGSGTGRWFDQLGGGGDAPATRDAITADDILALLALGVVVPVQMSWLLLHEETAHVTYLLEQIPADVDIWEVADETLAAGSPLERLWRLLQRTASPVDSEARRRAIAGKLLARKRPRLVPAHATEVQDLVHLGSGASCWRSLRSALADDRLLDQLSARARDAGLPARISLLRVLDVIVWMQATRVAATPDSSLAPLETQSVA
ncbi:MAG: DUF6308 family protein [Nocardioidaceae bacterium]